MKRYSSEYISTLYQAAQEKGTDSFLVGILELDCSGKIAEFNQEFYEMISYSESEIKNAFWMDFIFPEDLADAKYFFDRIKALQAPRGGIKLRFQKAGGEIVWLKLTLAPVSKAHSSHFILLAEDVSVAQKKEAHLNETVTRLKSLFDSMSEGVMFLSSDGRIVSHNKRAAEIFEFLPEELQGHVSWAPKGEFYTENHVEMTYEQFPTYLARKTGETIHEFVFQEIKTDGTPVWISMNVIPIFDSVGENGTGVVCTFSDITKRKDSESQLMHSAKLATLGEMSASIAHEIKNPLTVINAKIGFMKRKVDPATGLVNAKIEDLELIKSTAERINKIVKGLKSFSRTGEGDPFEVAAIKDIVADCFNLCDEKFKSAGLDFRIDVPEDLFFECRFVQISQVVINLVNNAFDAIQDYMDKWIELKVSKLNESYFEISVTDCGKGIPTEIAERLMNPFFTTKGRGKGTGLGLSISKKIIEAHHGQLTLDRSSPNTRFVIKLPFNQPAPSTGDNSDSQAA